MKSKKTKSSATATASALVYAVTYINLRMEDEEADDDVGALESIAAMLSNCTAEELEQLSRAAKAAFKEEQRSAKPREEFLDEYGSWMESMFGEDWDGNERTAE